MKTLRLFGMVLLAIVMSVNLSSCGDDENGSNDIIIVGGTIADKVDLGLPSGVKWASHNLGASRPEGYGDYFAWGETASKVMFSKDNSKTYGLPVENIGNNPAYDAATANWGNGWCLPSNEDIQELLKHCIITKDSINHIHGFMVKSKINGDSIFLPAAGSKGSGDVLYIGVQGIYHSSNSKEGNYEFSNHLFMAGTRHELYSGLRYLGMSIRPIYK